MKRKLLLSMCLALFEVLTVFSQNVVNSAYFQNNPQTVRML